MLLKLLFKITLIFFNFYHAKIKKLACIWPWTKHPEFINNLLILLTKEIMGTLKTENSNCIIEYFF